MRRILMMPSDIVDLLRERYDNTVEGKTKVFNCCGWPVEYLGASAVLTATAKLLKSTCDDSYTRKHFDRIVHVDCSFWKSRRTMQRAIAEELNLGHVMPIFDKQDEEDDFRGVEDSSRKQMPGIGSLINKSLRDERFLMIFHYGGNEVIDLEEFGIPTFGKGILLWADGGRFFGTKLGAVRLMQTIADIYIFMTIDSVTPDITLHRLLQEAIGVIGDTGMDGFNPEIVLDCFVYSLVLTAQLPENSTGVDYDWATHACNYWICDGILGEEKAWEIGNAFYRVIPMDKSTENTRPLAHYLNRRKRYYDGWYSFTYNKRGDDISSVPHSASSYFLTFQGDDPIYVHNDLFQLASKLHVLKLCNCSFDFAFPPFQSCCNLRFLWLEHCKNTGKEQSGVPIFSNLLVFDLRFTDYVLLPQMVELMTNLRELNTKGVSWKTMSGACNKLQKLHKLRVTESSDAVTVDSCFSMDMTNLELLDLSGNTYMELLLTLSSARSLKKLVLDGCSGVEHVALQETWKHFIDPVRMGGGLKRELFRDRETPVEMFKVTKISLHGCGQLQNIFLRGLPNLRELDLSGTSIKILDLRGMDAPRLRKLSLLGCQHLSSIIWKGSYHLEVLQVDTRSKTRSMVYRGKLAPFGFQARIAFTDGRFIRSVTEALQRTSLFLSEVYLLISCMSHSQAKITNAIKEIDSSREGLIPTRLFLPYNDIALAKDVTCPSLVWDHQQLQTSKVHIEIGEGSYNLEDMEGRGNFKYYVKSLHVHDNSSITTIPPMGPGNWDMLEWCHVERCPKLQIFFWSGWIFQLKIYKDIFSF